MPSFPGTEISIACLVTIKYIFHPGMDRERLQNTVKQSVEVEQTFIVQANPIALDSGLIAEVIQFSAILCNGMPFIPIVYVSDIFLKGKLLCETRRSLKYTIC